MGQTFARDDAVFSRHVHRKVSSAKDCGAQCHQRPDEILAPGNTLDCPGGTFQSAGVETVVLFFERGAPTRKVWFYQLDPGRNLGKTNPLNDADFNDFIDRQRTFADSAKSWSVDARATDAATCDLSVTHRSPQAIMEEIAALDAESAAVLETIFPGAL